ncbi:MAG: pyridoxal-phosphate dependent enzyme [Legionella sp.]|nr:MAG: pyridoxal-phosphate dependent enzyme [Legionella sp.]
MSTLTSRIHPLNHFPTEGVSCYVKRDDELSCGISGSKYRKYTSLMPYLMQQGIKHLLIIAGPQSNNLLAALQMAREFNLEVHAFLLKPWSALNQGNFKLSRLFLKDDEITWINRNEWPKVEEYAVAHQHTLTTPSFILTEGASVTAAKEGAMTLATDIYQNEAQLGFTFDHLFVDTGTGFTAAALIKGLKDNAHPGHIHVLLLADKEKEFKEKMLNWYGELPSNYSCFYPTTAKAFGSFNQNINNEIHRLAREEGILADPIYAAKLFYEARKRIHNEHLKGKVLIIHSGGTLTMPNFSY